MMFEKINIKELQNIIKSLFEKYNTKLTYLYKVKIFDNKMNVEGIGYKINRKFNEILRSTGFEVYEFFRNCISPDSRDIKSVKSCVIEKGDIEVFAYIYEIKTILFKKLYRIVYEIWRNECCLQILVHDFGII